MLPLLEPPIDNVTARSEELRGKESKMPAAKTSQYQGDASPFQLNERDVEVLRESEGFGILREHLAQHYADDLCASHSTTSALPSELHLLTRDILHALLVPVVELFDKATSLALTATHASRIEQLEYCYTGAARSAFVWLQCFLASPRERDWCYTKGCPACVVDHALDSEFSIRLLFAACLLSDVHYPFTLEGPTLPSFRFFLDELQHALERDELYGADFFERMQPKAIATREGIEELIYQCIELDHILSQPASPVDPSTPAESTPPSPVLGAAGGKGMKVKRSRLAKRQMRLEVEEEAWMEEMLRRCWDQLQPGQKAGMMPLPARSLDAVLKEGTVVVAEREVESDEG